MAQRWNLRTVKAMRPRRSSDAAAYEARGGPGNRDPATGRFRVGSARLEPPAPLLDALRIMARVTARRIYNDPRLDVLVTRRTLGWLLTWDPAGRQGVRQHVALQAANEARRWVASSPNQRTVLFGRSKDCPVLERRQHGTER